MLRSSVPFISFLFLIIVISSSGSTFFSATAQTLPSPSPESSSSSSSSSESVIKVFLPRAIEELENDNSTNALEHLKAIDQELQSYAKQNSSSAWSQTVLLLVQDAIEEVQDMNQTNALTYLKLALDRMGMPATISSNQSSATEEEVNDNFFTYDNSNLGIKIQYPASWSIVEYPYNPAGNNSIVGFFSDQKTSSELGNVSGVSGSFVPYLDIFSFDSKNMSLDTIFEGIVHNFRNNSNFVINQTGPFALSGNQSANMIVYDARVGGDELFRKIQIYTSNDNKVYVISFTAQQSLFTNYLPTVQKMVGSFAVRPQ